MNSLVYLGENGTSEPEDMCYLQSEKIIPDSIVDLYRKLTSIQVIFSLSLSSELIPYNSLAFVVNVKLSICNTNIARVKDVQNSLNNLDMVVLYSHWERRLKFLK